MCSSLLVIVSTQPGLILEDLSIHWDKPDSPECIECGDLINTFGLKQLVTEPTHTSQQALDYVITQFDDVILKSVHISDMITDHSLIIINLEVYQAKANSKDKGRKQLQYIMQITRHAIIVYNYLYQGQKIKCNTCKDFSDNIARSILWEDCHSECYFLKKFYDLSKNFLCNFDPYAYHYVLISIVKSIDFV